MTVASLNNHPRQTLRSVAVIDQQILKSMCPKMSLTHNNFSQHRKRIHLKLFIDLKLEVTKTIKILALPPCQFFLLQFFTTQKILNLLGTANVCVETFWFFI